MNFKAERLLILGFVGSMFLIPLLFFLLPQQRFSELENRYLQRAPQLTWDNIISNTFAEESELFITDHFPFREKWLWLKSASEKVRLQQENNDIYFGRDGYLFQVFEEPDFTEVLKNIESVNAFERSFPNVNMTFMLAPTSIGLYPERLPWLAPSYPQREVHRFIHQHMDNELAFIDGFDFLTRHAAQSIYYRTDHHWTTFGAYLAYTAFAEHKGWQEFSQEDYQIRTVSESFLGSYHTKGQFIVVKPDTIEQYIRKEAVKTSMYIADSDQTFSSMYDSRFLKKKDQYSYFLGGVHALMKLKTELSPQRMEQEKLLVIKDSFAHSVLPFLTEHVAEIHVIDLRYYNGSIHQYIADNEIKDVLFLFNTTSITNDTSLLKLN
ncbi:DHHW family protein [Lysinibacillus sp. 54212]|uniref:DHHW family protein n=1 Tax=Lysinibacillus sp. 54212 TaxID=3119829 RepID=UPI002FC67602